MGVKISNIEVYLPKDTLSNDDLAIEFPDWHSYKIEKKLGIAQRHIAAEDETALDLGIKATDKLVEKYDKNNIDFVILCTQSPDYYLPSSSCILQEKIGLRTDIGAFDYNLGCSGFVYGLGIAKGLINSGMANSVLLVTAETYSKHINKNDIANRSIFGDAGVATIIEKSDKEHVNEFIFGTNGVGKNNLIVPQGGFKHKDSGGEDKINDKTKSADPKCLFMNGPEIFNFTIEAVPVAISSVLEKNNCTMDDIEYVIFHQANKYILNYLRKKINIDKAKFHINMTETGNTVSATIPIALKDALENETIKKDDKVLICGFGVGYSWSATIIEI